MSRSEDPGSDARPTRATLATNIADRCVICGRSCLLPVPPGDDTAPDKPYLS